MGLVGRLLGVPDGIDVGREDGESVGAVGTGGFISLFLGETLFLGSDSSSPILNLRS